MIDSKYKVDRLPKKVSDRVTVSFLSLIGIQGAEDMISTEQFK